MGPSHKPSEEHRGLGDQSEAIFQLRRVVEAPVPERGKDRAERLERREMRRQGVHDLLGDRRWVPADLERPNDLGRRVDPRGVAVEEQVDDRLEREAGNEGTDIETAVDELAGRPSDPGDLRLPYDDVVQTSRDMGRRHGEPNSVGKISFALPGKR